MTTLPYPSPDEPQEAEPAMHIMTALAELPPHTLISEHQLAQLFGRHVSSIRRAIQRGELPPSVPLLNDHVWTAGGPLGAYQRPSRDGTAGRRADGAPSPRLPTRTRRTPLMAGVRKKPQSSGKYQAWFMDMAGKRTYFVGTRSRPETLRMAQRFEDEHRQIRLGYRPAPRPSDRHQTRPVADVVQEYLAWGQLQGGRQGYPWSATHLRSRRRHLPWWQQTLGLDSARRSARYPPPGGSGDPTPQPGPQQ